ncbi:MAG: methyl-accepting chemotaxis protein [Promethearchaeota archaeon]
MRVLSIVDNIGLPYKLIGGFIFIACLAGVVGIYSVGQISILDTSVSELVEVNVEQADWSMETIVAMEAQLITIHAALLGEQDMLGEYAPAYDVMMNGLGNLTLLLRGTTQESTVSGLESLYEDFHEACSGSNGVFVSMEDYEEAKHWIDIQFWRLDMMQDQMHSDLSLLEAMVREISANETLIQNALELNLLASRCSHLVQMYMAVPLNDSAEYNAQREQYRYEYCGNENLELERKYVANGLEKDFTDLLAETEINYAQALTNGQCNSTCKALLESVNTSFVYATHELGPLYDPFASSIRCPEDGIIISQNSLVTAWVAADAAMNTADTIGMELMEDLEALELWVGEQMDMAVTNSRSIFNGAVTMVAMVAAIAVILGAGFGLFLARSIVKPLDEVVDTAAQVAKGNLTVDTTKIDRTRKDEIGQLGSSFGTMVDKVIGDMVSLITQAQTSSEAVATSAEELASTSEEVNALSEEIAATIQQISRGAANQSELSAKGIEDVNKMAEVIDQSLNRIENTLQVIEDIAGQTNILALNAAIEAARAGEYGRGFAVVSDNVRRLAEETKKNSTDIGKLTEEIITNISGSVSGLQETLQGFAAQSEEFSASSEEVAAATEEQTAAMSQMTSAAQGLTKQGEELAQLVAQFEVEKKN